MFAIARLANCSRALFLTGIFVFTAACDDANTITIDPPPNPSLGEFTVAVLSSAPDTVSGAAARVGIGAPDAASTDSIVVELDGADVSSAFSESMGQYRLVGRIEGLVEGANSLRVYSVDENVDEATLSLTNYPETGPMFSGEQQQPFLCSTDSHRSGLELGSILDDDCSVERVVSFKYRTMDGSWVDYDPTAPRPADMATRSLDSGETAIMVKDRFVTAYGMPDYTVGVGGSGGGIQQYVHAQNHPGLIDAGVPQYSYPDMVTQTIHIGDCELIERWIDMQLMNDPNSKWADWNNRTWLIGLNASNDIPNDVVNLGLNPWVPPGSSECTAAWRGLSPLVLNPNFGTAPGITPQQQASVEWTHFADLINIYGTADDGFARSTWDNVGVQYGLQALRDGNISPVEFLDLNASVGSWKEEAEMVQEGCPFISAPCSALDFSASLYPEQIDPWSWRNANVGSIAMPGPRRAADDGAIQRAFDSGMVNRGAVEIPLIDWRHYLEGVLDMHNTHQSFAARQRLLNHDGDASNQLIWFVEPGEDDLLDNTLEAFAVIDEWMANIAANPNRTVGENRPAAAVDTCFASDGSVIASGDTVWNGVLDDEAAGVCTQRFPVFSTSRIVAGAPITGDVFKCDLQPVADAITAGVYADWVPSDEEVVQLEAIFPEGVCDYSES